LDKIAARVEEGFFPLAPAEKNSFLVVLRDDKGLVLQSDNLLTAVSSGPNCLALRLEGEGEEAVLLYRASFLTWTLWRFGLCALGAAALALARVALFPAWFSWFAFSVGIEPGTFDIILAAGIAFGAVGWPLLLVAFHRPVLRDGLERVFEEVARSKGTPCKRV
jgi:hypothetical protein